MFFITWNYNSSYDKILPMAKVNIKKALKQRVEMDDFFVENFSIKGVQIPDIQEVAPSQNDSAAEELAIISMEIEKCCCCELGQTRQNPVPGEGNPHARLVFVGEAPGADEDEQGRPFVGRAGQLLTKMIGAMGLERKDVFICNILKCRPPGNRDPKPEEVIKCSPFLVRQLEIIKPEVIVALGAHAARTLLKTNDAIGKMRGRFHQYIPEERADPIKLMPTYHPSYLLRNYSVDNRKRVWEDLQKVMDLLGLEQ